MKQVIFDGYESFLNRVAAPSLRGLGQGYYKAGVLMQGRMNHDESPLKSLRSLPNKQGTFPKLADADFVAPNATIIGDVKCGENSSIWYTSVIRGDTASISIGHNSVVQDKADIFSSSKKNAKVNIGNDVFVGPNVLLDGCTLQDSSFVAMGATVHNGAVIESDAIVAAGSVIEKDTKVPSGQIWAGNPAQYLRDASAQEKEVIREHHHECVELARIHAEENELTFRELIDHDDETERRDTLSPLDEMTERLWDEGFPRNERDNEYIEQRIHDDFMTERALDDPDADQTTEPYEDDATHFPEVWKLYHENFDRYERVKSKFESEGDSVMQNDTFDRVEFPDRKSGPWNDKF